MKAFIITALLPLALASQSLKRTPVIVPRDAQTIPNKYIIKLRDGVNNTAVEDVMSLTGSDADHVYKALELFKGFAGTANATELEALQTHPDVEYIEQDAVVKISSYTTQTGSTWGLGRISHQSNGYTQYYYDTSAGEDVCAYVIDTGIYVDHEEFEGRATFLANYADSTDDDLNGHGTHVSGTIGGVTYGVAKKVSLFAVKVLDEDGSGTTSGVIAGMNYVADDAQTRDCPNGAVANMSLGGSYSRLLNKAAAALVEAGVFLAVAAGNDGEDASSSSPASEESACTIAAINSNDRRPYWSNYGDVVDVFAPGVDVLSAYIGDEDATATESGTSMATPHITGLAAYLLAFIGSMEPEELCAYIADTANSGYISNPGTNTVNLIGYNGSGK